MALPNRRKPLGPALNWTDAELDRLATLDPLSPDFVRVITESRNQWRRHAPPALRKLIDAVPVEESDNG